MKITGDLTCELAVEYSLQAHKLARELGVDCFLMDLRESRNVESNGRNYSFASHQIKEVEGIDLSAKIAALISPGDRSHNFITKVFQNSGLDLTLFTDQYAAVRHLMGESD